MNPFTWAEKNPLAATAIVGGVYLWWLHRNALASTGAPPSSLPLAPYVPPASSYAGGSSSFIEGGISTPTIAAGDMSSSSAPDASSGFKTGGLISGSDGTGFHLLDVP